MAEIYVLNLNDCGKEILSLADKISQKRALAVKKMKNESAALQKIASEVLLAYSLKAELPLETAHKKYGKPYIASLPFFNISNSTDYVVCAVSNKEVGVDVEKISRMKNTLARHILSTAEYENEQTVSGARLQTLLCEKWTRKESYLKMLGVGLRRKMTDLTFAGDTLLGEDVFSRVYGIDGGYLLAFCRSAPTSVSIINVTKQNLIDYFKIEM